MAKRLEPQFDVRRATWMNMRYPNNGPVKDEIIKREAKEFEEKVRRDLCAIKELNAGRS